MHACLPFAFEETEEKPIVVVVTPLTAIIFMKDQVVMTYFISIKLCECHPHTSGLHKFKYCVMPDPFPAERFVKSRATPD